jgi:hypothetical protein
LFLLTVLPAVCVAISLIAIGILLLGILLRLQSWLHVHE